MTPESLKTEASIQGESISGHRASGTIFLLDFPGPIWLGVPLIGRHRPNGRPKRQGTLRLEREYFDRVIFPRFGKSPVSGLTRNDVQRLLDEVSPQALASARHCRNLIRQAYNDAIRRDVASWNPAQFAEVPAPIARERVLTDDEVRLIWTTARNPAAVEGLELSPAMGLAICL